MARGSIDKNLAGKVFKLQNTYGTVPPAVLAIAHRVFNGAGSKADVDALRKYLGIQKSGATQRKREFGAASKSIQDIFTGASLAKGAMQGGAGGFISAAGFVNFAADKVGQLATSKTFKAAVEKAAMKHLGDPVVGTRLVYAMGRGARMVGAAAKPLLFGILATKAISDFAAGGGDERRTQEAELALSKYSRMDGLRRTLLREKAEADTPLSQIATADVRKGVPLLGKMISSALGLSAERREQMETAADLREAGYGRGVNVKEVRAEARLRRNPGIMDRAVDGAMGAAGALGWLNPVGNLINKQYEKWQQGKDTAKVKEMRQAADKYKKLANEEISLGNFEAGAAYMRQANVELPGAVPAWKNPANSYTRMENARVADKAFAYSQMTLSGPRTGD